MMEALERCHTSHFFKLQEKIRPLRNINNKIYDIQLQAKNFGRLSYVMVAKQGGWSKITLTTKIYCRDRINQMADEEKAFTSDTSASSLQIPVPKPPSHATDWDNQDTIHYLSPATTARTLCEGDFDYSHFIPFVGSITLSKLTSESSISCEEGHLQRTIAIIKPEAMEYKDVALKAIIDNGFSIINQRTIHLTPEQVTELYAEHYGCPTFPNMVVSTSIGPLLVLSLAGVNAVEKWKEMVGPYKTLPAEWFLPLNVRNRFGLHVDIPDALHASENIKAANKENRSFYPDSILEPIIDDQLRVEDYCNLHINPTLLKGLVALVRKKPVDPIIFLAEWLLLNNPYKPHTPHKYAMAPT